MPSECDVDYESAVKHIKLNLIFFTKITENSVIFLFFFFLVKKMTVDSYMATNLWDESLMIGASNQIRIQVYMLFVFIF